MLGLINVTAAVCMMLTVRIFIDSCLIAFVTTSWCRGSALSHSHVHTPLFPLCCVSASSRYMRSAPQSFTCSHATVRFVLCVSQVSLHWVQSDACSSAVDRLTCSVAMLPSCLLTVKLVKEAVTLFLGPDPHWCQYAHCNFSLLRLGFAWNVLKTLWR